MTPFREFVTNHCDMQPQNRREKVKNLALATLEAGMVKTLREATQGPKKVKADKQREANAQLAEAFTAPFFDANAKLSDLSLELAQTLPAQYKAYLADELKEADKVGKRELTTTLKLTCAMPLAHAQNADALAAVQVAQVKDATAPRLANERVSGPRLVLLHTPHLLLLPCAPPIAKLLTHGNFC